MSAQLETRPDRPRRAGAASASRDIALIDLVDRLLGGGVVLTGDITLAVADIDLVQVALRALISSVSTAEGDGAARQNRQEAST
ncbi:MAG TPA: gas vesicle protein [Solirubrobacteraceae bacterium]|nr:gas vesicle protein [Solirubrobacteraceae bacterium]